ncbi:MAG TPA: YgiQ family radical SAM protein [candidate division WOR-3 bacterium]|uniref:YgiQ family radical SAM protein n=1 Tax=candidate division WOR-3 bacterium TaxID=2052148 RepID=A0A7C5DDF4_UNCW3|nr:YgiQ family radical SAM protein [candidate division WOR-3 bacterium]
MRKKYRGETEVSEFIPVTPEESRLQGWDKIDIVLITGDAYIDHPSFGIAILARVLKSAGFKVAIIPQPDWRSLDDFKRFGRPRLFFGISSGNMDSMVNKYTSLKKVRNDDMYSEYGKPFKRPDRAVIVYTQRVKEAYRDVPVVIGGIEASLRRLAHYDYWSNSVRRSILLDSKADLLVYGMGESQIEEIAKRLNSGENIENIQNIRGTVFPLGKNDKLTPLKDFEYTELPSYEDIVRDKRLFNEATLMLHNNSNPHSASALIQQHDTRRVVQLPPAIPLSQSEIDKIYSLPFTRLPHPIYKGPIPAYETIKHSVTIMRGCFGGCSFCSITVHQGRIIQSRSEESILNEIKKITTDKRFKGTISDLGGPTANMYKMGCKDRETQARCKRLSCMYPSICKKLKKDHKPLINLMKKAREIDGVKHLFISSGIRMDLALTDKNYIREIVFNHVSGHLKVAPEHVSKKVLRYMFKPNNNIFDNFIRLFYTYSKEAGKEQYLIPYLISSHPGADLEAELELALYLKEKNLRPRQIQDFLPTPMDIATAMYYTEIDPIGGDNIYVAKKESEKKLHRAIIQFFKKENREIVKRALKTIGCTDALKLLY